MLHKHTPHLLRHMKIKTGGCPIFIFILIILFSWSCEIFTGGLCVSTGEGCGLRVSTGEGCGVYEVREVSPQRGVFVEHYVSRLMTVN